MVNMFEDDRDEAPASLADAAVEQLMQEARERQGGRDMLSIPNYRDARTDEERDEFY